MRQNLLRGIALLAGSASAAALITVAVLQGTFALIPLAVIIPAWSWPLAYVRYRGKRTTLLPLHYGLVLAFLTAALTAIWFFLVASEHFPASYQSRSPCGQSSCSRTTNQALWPFAPHGYFPDRYGANDVKSLQFVMCHCPSCAWAGDNALYPPIIGFGSPDGHTLNASDPLPAGGLASPTQFQGATNAYRDPAYGIAGGIEPGLGTTVNNVAFCPAQGRPICSRCLQYFRNTYGYTDPATDYWCPTTLYPPEASYSCYLCPMPGQCANVAAYAWAYGVLGLVLLGLFLTTLINR